ncbi:MAG: AAA family ATPase [Verrucomicrobiota bacterium]
MDYAQLARLCLRHWKWLVAGLVLGGAAGIGVALSETTIYAARATIVVAAKEAGLQSDQQYSTDTKSGDMIKTFEQMLQTRDLPERVVHTERLNEDPKFLPPGVTPPVSEDYAALLLAGATEIKIRPMTRLIDITVESPSPEMAKFLANRLAQGVDRPGLRPERQHRHHPLRLAAEGGRRAAHPLRRRHRQGDRLPEGPQDDRPGRRRGHGPGKHRGQKPHRALHRQARGGSRCSPRRYGPEHPKLIQARHEADELHNEILKANTGALDESSESIEYTNLKEEADSLPHAAHRHGEGGSTTPAPPSPSPTPASPSPSSPACRWRLCGRARSRTPPSAPSPACSAASATSSRSISSTPPSARSRRLRACSTCRSSPRCPSFRRRKAPPSCRPIPTHSPSSPSRSAACARRCCSRTARTRCGPCWSAAPSRARAKASARANLGMAFAQAGLKTLLIDADLRLPTMHTYFNVTADEHTQGLPAVLSGRSKLEAAVITAQVPQLDLLLTTRPAESPAELLSNRRLYDLLDGAADKYDRVVIDSAPLNAVSDTMLVMPRADAILLVVRAGQTPASESRARRWRRSPAAR